jgi:glycosyltransferase involved in cell wall biosynthesis
LKTKPRLLVVSAVYPFPRNAGQQQRVYYTLKALRNDFHITFLTYAELEQRNDVEQELLGHCDDVMVLPSTYMRSLPSRIFYKLAGLLYALATGLKVSNYVIGEVEFSLRNLEPALSGRHFDCVLFEYWHAHKATAYFRGRGIPSILDMHDVLWRSYTRQWDARKWMPGWLKDWFIQRYKAREEAAWSAFDMVIAINQDELNYARQILGDKAVFLYAPMGTDISTWPFCWQPAQPRRVAYYGGLGSPHNQQDALLCYREIMPRIWQEHPDTEFWIVGSKPPDFIRGLARDSRVHVTGFVEQVQDVLKTMSLVLCPWSGTYGFRSRVVEVMSLGVPVAASNDAVYGMGFEVGQGIVLANTPAEIAGLALEWLADEKELNHQSLLARQQMEEKFSYEATYVRLSHELIGKISASHNDNRPILNGKKI